MNADFFFKFTKFKFGSLVNAEDFSDKVNYQWTASFLIISTALIAMRQYIFTPIQCWVPPEWPRPWEEYTENYCWIQNTYRVSMDQVDHPDYRARTQAELNYYQWVPFVLALEAMLVYVPHMVWKILTIHTGYNPNAIVKFASEATTVDQDKKEKFVTYLAMQIEKAMRIRRRWRRDKCLQKLHDVCYNILPCFWFGRRSGTMLFALYITNKILYVLIGFLHLYIMKVFLGFKSLAFGWHCFMNLARGQEWEETLVFPRVTFCDVPYKTVGQWNTRSVQCVLPVNLLNEKIYIFLWFWTILGICMTILSTIVWIVRLLIYKNRQNFIKKYLRILHSVEDELKNRDYRKKFVNQFLAYDGIFLLRMIAENVGELCVADIVDKMFHRFMAEEKGEEPPPIQPLHRKASSVSQRRVSTIPATPTDSDFKFGKKSDV